MLGAGVTGTDIAAPGATPGGDVVVVPGGTRVPIAPSGKPGTKNSLTQTNAMRHKVYHA